MRVYRHDQLGSTNDEAIRLALAGEPGGAIVVARQQTAGRGRQGRSWVSPPGNLHASFLLRPNAPPGKAIEIGFVAAVAIAATLDRFTPGAALKWPNDALLGGAKIAGILTEIVSDAVVVGIGVNVVHTPPNLPNLATSLAAAGVCTTADAVLDILQDELRQGLAAWAVDGFDPVRTLWLQRGPALGEAVRVRMGARLVDGAFAGLATDGALLLQTPEGTRRVVAGEVA